MAAVGLPLSRGAPHNEAPTGECDPTPVIPAAASTFCYGDEVGGRTFHYPSNDVPDVDAAGRVNGFCAMTFDITEL